MYKNKKNTPSNQGCEMIVNEVESEDGLKFRLNTFEVKHGYGLNFKSTYWKKNQGKFYDRRKTNFWEH